METQRVQMKGVLNWPRRAGTSDFYCFPHRTIYVSPSPSNLGRQSCRAACSLNVCLRSTLYLLHREKKREKQDGGLSGCISWRGGGKGRVVGATSNEGVMSVGFFSTTIIRKLRRRVTVRSSFPICEHGSRASGQIPYIVNV
jgi:hypothetical protein